MIDQEDNTSAIELLVALTYAGLLIAFVRQVLWPRKNVGPWPFQPSFRPESLTMISVETIKLLEAEICVEDEIKPNRDPWI